MQGPRSVALGRSQNCRDVGGLTTKDGRRVRRGLLYRSDLPVLDQEHDAHLDALGLRTVIDLREPEEREARPSVTPGPALRVVSKSFGLGPLVAADPRKAHSLRRLYDAAIRELGGPMADVVAELCAPSALPALVHCTAGKDRTGIIIGIVLSALGVPDEDVARDYAVTAENIGSEFFRRINHDHPRVDLTQLVGADASEMMRMLALVHELAGDARSYLVSHGVAPDDLDRLTQALLIDAG